MRLWILGLLLCQLAWAAPLLKSISIYEKKPNYTIKVKYPGPNAAALKLVQAEIANFKKEEPTPGCMLELGYEVIYSNSRLTSILFGGYVDMRGAHPSGFEKALILSPDGEPITLQQCFRGDGWMKVVESYSRQEFARRKLDSDPGWIKTGTEAKAENYQVVLPDSKGLQVYFSDYQVAPHVVGPQQVLVPWSLLHQEIDPQGPLAGF